jgi:hypothetical protein
LYRYGAAEFTVFSRWATSFAAWYQLIALLAFVAVQGVDYVIALASTFAIWFPAHIGSAL